MSSVIEFMKAFIISLFSGFISTCISPKSKPPIGVVITGNRNTTIQNVRANGHVEISKNKYSEIKDGDFNERGEVVETSRE